MLAVPDYSVYRAVGIYIYSVCKCLGNGTNHYAAVASGQA